ncbi:MAG: glutamate racemase [Faecalibacterium sp.]|nr:glutamate racemase [Faecalibacterium sp.]
MDNRPIGVFDSGLGGLTAVRELRKILPGEDIVYFGDTGRVPYGSRGREIILQYTRQDIRFLLSKDVKYVMAACGTVSSTYPLCEAAGLPVPYTGVVRSAAEAAAAASKNGRIGVIGTPATIRSGSYEQLLNILRPEAQIFTRACPMFVPLVENGYVNDGNPVALLLIEEYLTDLKAAGIDTLILGCTHYPLLKKMIGDFVGDEVRLIDPGKITAHAVKAALQSQNLLATPRPEGGHASFFVSDSTEGFKASADLFLGEYKGGPVQQIAIDKY